jgi:signal transduction histidine kinase
MFENFGVPISKDEIENGSIFQFGYRGMSSSDRGRMGSGIGLYDARSTAIRYGGNISIESHPVHPGTPEEDYTVPHLTKVIFSLPRYLHDLEVYHEKNKGSLG